MKHCIVLLTLSLSLLACGGPFISAKEERKLGKDVHSQLLKEYKLIKPSHSLGKCFTEFLRPLTSLNRFRSVEQWAAIAASR